jgi:hypothetical protein
MAVISISERTDWFIARHEFGKLINRMTDHVHLDEDKEVLARAEALDGLTLMLLPDDQRRRIRETIEIVAPLIASETRSQATDVRDHEFADALDELVALIQRT